MDKALAFRTGRHIDPHVHCRDWDESGKATIREITQLARSQGIAAIADMPNTRPSITTREAVERRLQTAEAEGSLQGYYLYIGLTNDPAQVREAAQVATTHPRVVGLKLFAGRSTNDLSVTDVRDQRMIYRELAQVGYEGLLAVHCEKESLCNYSLFVPEMPATWNLAKPRAAEIWSVKDQITFADEEKFRGYLHICHASVPDTVYMVNNAMKKGRVRAGCGITPHHWTYSTEDMRTPDGVALKVNPPVRDWWDVLGMRNVLRDGLVNWIETDTAPHAAADKTYAKGKPKEAYASGIRSIDRYSAFLGALRSGGLGDGDIERLTCLNIKEVLTKITE